ncbi:MAG: SDR family oxidoreductase [Actinomycetota bacterium]|nr:SDR family oxidoreductase [Actinomycetota bacterium]
MPIALVTGASRGLGKALAQELGRRGWQLVVDARNGEVLKDAAQGFGNTSRVAALAGDVGDPTHRDEMVQAVHRMGRLDLLVNNASTLGPVPRPDLGAYPLDELERVIQINTIAPLGLIQALLPELTANAGSIINVSSDAAVEPYAGWGGYGSSKAALDQLSAVLAEEQPAVRIYSFDPGDMRTEMQQQAFPGEDISDRAEPKVVVPSMLRLVDERPPSGRYRANDLRPLSDGSWS